MNMNIKDFLSHPGTVLVGILGMVALIAVWATHYAKAKEAAEAEWARTECRPFQEHISDMVIYGLKGAQSNKDLVILRMELDKYRRLERPKHPHAICNDPQEYNNFVNGVGTPRVAYQKHPEKKSHALAGAVVGGLLLGPAGMVAGAVVGK